MAASGRAGSYQYIHTVHTPGPHATGIDRQHQLERVQVYCRVSYGNPVASSSALA